MKRAFVFAVSLTAVGSTARAQVPAGGEFRVNTYTTNRQWQGSVSMDASGNFVVVWAGRGDGDYDGIFGQRFDTSGTPQGPEFQVNTHTGSLQDSPSVSCDAVGNFTVVWSSDWQDGSYYGIFGQRFDTSGTAQGLEFQVNTYTARGQDWPSVASDAVGDFVVVWRSRGQDGSDYGIFGQRFNSSRVAQGGEFQVNTFTPGWQENPRVAMSAAGDFVVVWEGDGDGPFDVSGQRYDATGTALGPNFRVNTYIAQDQDLPSVASDAAGNFVVVWTSHGSAGTGQDGDRSGVFGQRFDSSGKPQGAEFQVNTYTTGYQVEPSVASDAAGNFVVVWMSLGQDGSRWGVFGQRYDRSGTRLGGEFQVNTYTTGSQYVRSVASDPNGNFVVTWASYGQDGSSWGIFAQRFGGLLPVALAVDEAPVHSDGNGVLEAGESVVVSPSWRNVNGAALTFNATASSFTGPGSPGDPDYRLADGAADYGTVANATTGNCGADCYLLGLSTPTTRPVQHWDASVREDILPVALGQSKTWTLHVGESFPDVPRSHPLYRFVETILHLGVTSGCTATDFCPEGSVLRKQMAVFLLKSKLGKSYVPPPATGIFGDVPASDSFAPWIEDLYNRGITGGCSAQPLLFCPDNAVLRKQMAVFLLKTREGSTYTPPACSNPTFGDVPCSNPFAAWIYELVARAITSGCGGGNYCPGSAITRGQMAVFLTRTFGLLLYGP